LRCEISFRIFKHTIKFEGINGTNIGRKVRIYSVFIIPQILFIVIPKNAAKKKFIAMELAMLVYKFSNKINVLLEAPK